MKIAIVGNRVCGPGVRHMFCRNCVNANVRRHEQRGKSESLQKGTFQFMKMDWKRVVLRNMKAKRLKFTTSLESCLDEVEVIFSAVGTPPDEDGS